MDSNVQSITASKRNKSPKRSFTKMKKLPQQIATDADSHSLERAFSVREENLKNTKEIVKYLNNLCTVLVNVKELPNRDGFYNDVCKRYVLNFQTDSILTVKERICVSTAEE
ncbi:hypothetical protein ACH3XW_20985 [Acanthocheilonema viteae]